MVDVLTPGRRFRRIGSSPFTSLGEDWCPRCRMQVETDNAAEHRGTTFVYRVRCERCGKVLKSGIYDQVILLSEKPLPPAALEWVIEPGRDRRGKKGR